MINREDCNEYKSWRKIAPEEITLCSGLDKIEGKYKKLNKSNDMLRTELDKLNNEIQLLRNKFDEIPVVDDITAKRRFDIGDVVLCHKFSVESRMVISGSGINLSEPYIDDSYFNRKAYISNTYKRRMEQHGGVDPEDKDEYEITFLDNGNSLAWVSGYELTLLLKH